MSIQTFNVYEGLTSVKLVSVINLVGDYNNGNLNNGVGAFIKIPSSTFSIDMVEVQIGDSILLCNQTNANENGIYVCIQTGGIYSFSVIQRRNDFQSLEQIKSGQYVSVQDGLLNKGASYTIVEPLPNFLGVDGLDIICTSPSFKVETISATDLTGLENEENRLVVLSGLKTVFENPINMADPLNHQIVNVANRIDMNGVTSGFIIGSGQLMRATGAVTSNAFLLGTGIDINLADASVDQSIVVGLLINLESIGTPTNVSNVAPEWIINGTGVTLDTFKKIDGDATYLFKSTGAASYFATAGNGAGQAGDPAHCNAQNVLKVSINGSDKFIGLFDTN